MKKLLILMVTLTMSIFVSLADTTKTPQQPDRNEGQRQVILIRKFQATDKVRMPAMPMYGNFDGETLTVDIRGAEDNEILTAYFHCENSVDQQNCTAAELRQGISVTVDSPFWLEIVTESGVVYIEVHQN